MNTPEELNNIQAAVNGKKPVPEKNQASINWLKAQSDCMIYIDWDNDNEPRFPKNSWHTVSRLIEYLEEPENNNCAVVQADNYKVYLRYYEPGNDCDLFSFILVKPNNLQFANIPMIPGEGQ